MIVKAPKPPGGIFKKTRLLFHSRKRVITGLLGLAGLGFTTILVFGIIGLGAYQNRVAEDNYYQPALFKIANFDFSPLKKWIKGGRSEFEGMKVSIAPQHLRDLEHLQQKAQEEGMITDSLQAESFPAKLDFRGKTHEVKIALTGNLTMHFKEPLQWSFQVKTKGEDTVEGMQRFNLWLPATGMYLRDWLATDLLRERGLKGLHGDFVRVSINGESAGVFYLEENFDKDLPEQHRFGDGMIFSIEQGLVFYGADKLEQDPTTKAQMILLRQKWQDLTGGNLPLKAFFDLDKMGKLAAQSDLMNYECPFGAGSAYFYYDPLTGLSEPIAANLTDLHDLPDITAGLFVTPPAATEERYLRFSNDLLISRLHQDLDFKRAYIGEAELISQDIFISRLLARNGNPLNYLVKKVYQNWPDIELPTATLYARAKYMRYMLFPDVEEVAAYLEYKTNNSLNITLQNLRSLPVEVAYLSWRDSVFFYPRQTILLSPAEPVESKAPTQFEFLIPPNISWSDTLLPELQVNYSIAGLRNGAKGVLVLPWSFENNADHFDNPIAGKSSYQAFDFIQEDKKLGVLSIPAGNWSISEDLIIPADKRFQIAAGAKIDLTRHARIVSYSPIFCLGTEKEPITITSSDSTGEGLLVIGAKQESKLYFTNFDQLSCPVEQGWSISGSVAFYESPVHIQSCSFASNLRGDDFLNIVRSTFTMEAVNFNNILADAFDCDFCKGSIRNSTFINIGNDGVDVSGTELEVSHVYMEFIGDKGLSAGESSNMTAEWIDIRNAEIGIASKDGSSIVMKEIKLLNAKIGITLFQKKPEYGPGYINAERVSTLNSEIPYLVEQRSRLIIDGNSFTTNQEKVRTILYGAEYGKSSK